MIHVNVITCSFTVSSKSIGTARHVPIFSITRKRVGSSKGVLIGITHIDVNKR